MTSSYHHQEYVPYQGGYTIEELIDLVQNELTITCALPKTLPDASIRQIVETRCQPYFYRNYQYAVQKLYYIINKEAFHTDEWARYKFIEMPPEIQSVIYLYEIRNESLFQLGINSPNLSINLGVTNQPYLSSYVSTIADLGVYKTLLDNMSDMMNQLNKYTLKHQFNYLNHRLHILTDVKYSVVVEAYANILPENLYKDDLFFKYVVGYSKIQLGNMLSRYSYQLPGGITINGAEITSQGKEETKEVEEEIKGQSTTGWFIMVKR